jgi:hypothetical protein
MHLDVGFNVVLMVAGGMQLHTATLYHPGIEVNNKSAVVI